MSAESIIQTLSDLGLDIQVSGENLVVEDEDEVLTSELSQAIRQHKQALLVLVKVRTTQSVQRDVVPRPACETEYQAARPAAKVPVPTKRCEADGGARWGYLRVDRETFPSSCQHKTLVQECLDCTAKTCPECWRDNIVIDVEGQYCVDCRQRIIRAARSRPQRRISSMSSGSTDLPPLNWST